MTKLNLTAAAETVKNIKLPVRTIRDDMKAAEQMVRAAVASEVICIGSLPPSENVIPEIIARLFRVWTSAHLPESL